MSQFNVSPEGKSYTTYSTDELLSPVSIVARLAQQMGQHPPRVTGELRSSLSRSTLRILDMQIAQAEAAVSYPHGRLIVDIANLGEQILEKNEDGLVQPPLPDWWVDAVADMVEKVTTVEAWAQYEI